MNKLNQQSLKHNDNHKAIEKTQMNTNSFISEPYVQSLSPILRTKPSTIKSKLPLNNENKTKVDSLTNCRHKQKPIVKQTTSSPSFVRFLLFPSPFHQE